MSPCARARQSNVGPTLAVLPVVRMVPRSRPAFKPKGVHSIQRPERLDLVFGRDQSRFLDPNLVSHDWHLSEMPLRSLDSANRSSDRTPRKVTVGRLDRELFLVGHAFRPGISKSDTGKPDLHLRRPFIGCTYLVRNGREREAAMTRRERLSNAAKPSLSLNQVALCLVALISPICARHALSQPVSTTSPPLIYRNAIDRQWFEDAKFGLAIPWGLYSLVDKDEWVMEHDRLPITQYDKLPSRFHASRFDAGAWVRTAKAARARYLTVVAKHHDGFCMFASKLTTYDIIDAAHHRTDPIRALADACHQEGIKLFLYYSLLDWHHPDYFPRGKTGQKAGRDAKGQWQRYIAYYQGQIRELCTNYGEIGGFWLDGCWDRPEADWQLDATYRLIHELQPRALIANDRRLAAMAGEDFRVVRLNPVGEDRSQLAKLAANSELPLEICWPINAASSNGAAGSKILSGEQVVHALVGAAGRGANFSLEVRALPDGGLPPEVAQTLEAVGKWLATFGQAVFNTRRGPIAPQPWGYSTVRGSPEHPQEIYLHILTSKEDIPVIFDPSISWVPSLFGRKNPLKLTRSGRGLILELPRQDRLPIDTIVTLTPRPAESSPKAR